jgi:hypothetical protein
MFVVVSIFVVKLEDLEKSYSISSSSFTPTVALPDLMSCTFCDLLATFQVEDF